MSFYKMNIFHLASRSCRGFTNIFIFIVVVLVTFFFMRLLEVSQSPDANLLESQSLGQDLAINLDYIPGKLRLSAPDADGKVKVIISMDAKSAASYIDKKLHEAPLADASLIAAEVKVLKENTDMCKGAKNLKYVVHFVSKPEAQHLRDTQRKSWGMPDLFKNYSSRLVFMIGKPAEDADGKIQEKIDKEFQEHGDIVQGDFIDTLRNATLKSILGITWVHKNCPTALYTLRAVDETFVNIFELNKLMDRHIKERRVLMCPLWKDRTMPILRDPTVCGAWCVKETEFPGESHFPQYCAFMMCIISRELLVDFYRATRSTPFFFISDVYVTGMLPKRVPHNIHYVDMLGGMSLNWTLISHQYLNSTDNPTVAITQFGEVPKHEMIWKGLLRRLPITAVNRLSDSVKQQLRS